MTVRNKMFALLLFGCAQNAFAQERCGYRVSMLVSGFERGEQPADAELPAHGTPLMLNLTSPNEGAVIATRTVQVR